MGTPHRPYIPPHAPTWAPLRALPWADQAACATVDPELFFPDQTTRDGHNHITVGGERVPAAKFICSRCPAKADCLQYALDDPHLQGIWGGTTDTERRQMRSRVAATRCREGHPYTEENVYIRPNGQRECRICSRAKQARYRESRRHREAS